MCSNKLLVSESKEKFDIKKYLRKPVLVFENTELSKLQEIFRKEKQNMVVVIDEYGGTLGIATLEDLNEEIFGNIADEYDTDDAAAEEPNLDNINDESTQNLSQTILGSMRLSDLNENLGTSFSSEYYDTIGGLIMEIFPVEGNKRSPKRFCLESPYYIFFDREYELLHHAF